MYHMVEEFAALSLAVVTDLDCLQAAECVLPFPVVRKSVSFIWDRRCCWDCAVGDRGELVSTKGSTITFPHGPPSSHHSAAPARETGGISNLLA